MEEKSEMTPAQETSPTEAQISLANFWPKVMEEINNVTAEDFKHQSLPLARIKKIMKLDDDVKMISAEAPMLFAKAAEIFINELTLRAWTHTEDNKRRTLQRSDIAMAVTINDQFDFLIDIVPRDEIKPQKPREEGVSRVLTSEQIQYYVQLAQQQNQAQQQQQQTVTQATNNTTEVTTQNVTTADNAQTATLTTPLTTSNNSLSNIQIMQQIVSPSGEVQHVPISVTPAQLNMIRMQMQNNTSQPIVLQALPRSTAQSQILQVGQNNGASVYLTSAASISESNE
ncbi:nuclear transcription factor Y subunit gamma-like [Ctenocephalides felis]|uniref:nuclear transcription factor Y subunit gamma-like n=1 Tax=Ctenocephalides felis TaxID=7515 RepID=UPI000E6E2980|nr:nuclear transcription factor Y subunit gamma-like [Ctenocephalides felis]XP_026470212.1 nuclear transcription factor Y subunit gamma-like [Ctenocephalides felis]